MNSLSDSGGRAERGLGFEWGRCVGRTDAGAPAELPPFGPPERAPGRDERESACPADFEAGLYGLPAEEPGRDEAGLAGRSVEDERGLGRDDGRAEEEGGALRFKVISATKERSRYRLGENET